MKKLWIKPIKTGILITGLFVPFLLVSQTLTLTHQKTVNLNQKALSTEDSTLETFRGIEEEWLNAVQFEAKPRLQSRLEALLAKDFLYQHGSGQNFTKEAYIDLLVTDGVTVTERGSLALSVRDYGDTVITFGSSSMSGEVFGESYDGQLRFVNVWRRQPDGHWLLTHRNSELL